MTDVSVKSASAVTANVTNAQVSREKYKGRFKPHLVCVHNGAFIEYGYCSECGREFDIDINNLPLSCPDCLCEFQDNQISEYCGDLVDY